jgi:hypothetical protein
MGLGGCVSAVPSPTRDDARWAQSRWPDTTVDVLAQGRALYVDKCAGCHQVRPARRVVRRGFPQNFDEMARKAHLSPAERNLILRYLVAVTRFDQSTAGGERASR